MGKYAEWIEHKGKKILFNNQSQERRNGLYDKR